MDRVARLDRRCTQPQISIVGGARAEMLYLPQIPSSNVRWVWSCFALFVLAPFVTLSSFRYPAIDPVLIRCDVTHVRDHVV